MIEGISISIEFDDNFVADAASNLIVRESDLNELYKEPVSETLRKEVDKRIHVSAIKLQRAGVVVWNAFSGKWDVYDDSCLAHLQEGRA